METMGTFGEIFVSVLMLLFIVLSIFSIFFAPIWFIYKKLFLNNKLKNALRVFSETNPSYSFSPGPFVVQGSQAACIYNLGVYDVILNSAYAKINGIDTWVFQHQYETTSNKSRTLHRYAVCQLKIGKRLPHIIIDSKRNGRGIRGTVLQRSNIVPISGNFENDFTFYAQTGLEQEALEIFTPDILEAVKKYTMSFDIEIIEDSIFLYDPKTSTDPKAYKYMSDAATYLASMLIDELKAFKMPEILTKPGANFKQPRQITVMTKRQKLIVSMACILLFSVYVVLNLLYGSV